MTAISMHDILLRPVISEKSVMETERNNYTFAVARDANKFQIKAGGRGRVQGHRPGRAGPDRQAQAEAPRPAPDGDRSRLAQGGGDHR